MNENPLVKVTGYPQVYQPGLLVGIPRKVGREILFPEITTLPFQGADVWNAYELSCLNARGKPVALLGRFIFPASSSHLVESKSLKLYLNSLNQAKFESVDEFAATLSRDLAKVAEAPVEVAAAPIEDAAMLTPAVVMPELPTGVCLDSQDIECDQYQVSRSLLKEESDSLFTEVIEEVLFTNLFRSNCPVTNQPDWATVTISYQGNKIPHDSLLRYLVSYRQHNDYHENCVEQIFCDLIEVFSPQSLTVEANFLRRGGLDINPIRTTQVDLNYKGFPRYIRQ